MNIDGKKIAEEVLLALEHERASLGELALEVVMNEGDPATDSFVKIKTRTANRLGVKLVRYTPEQMAEAVRCDGVIIQLPLPNADELIAALPPHKDVDGLGEDAIVRPPVAEAISEILVRHNIAGAGMHAVVVGAGRLVGAPAAALLKDLGAEVTTVTQTRGSLVELKEADIVVLGAGEPGLIKPEMLKEGVVLIDAGTSEQGGRLAGDADPACAQVASLYTPVPGGIGPIAVAMIFKNLFLLAKKNSGI
jgi:methylenetetrahydrofolate dehydrogenase (NADP+)/methenyltetrahydrofolate cyclohydrolase